MAETTNDDDDTEYDGVETDWLADCSYGYGFGYTKHQALAEMIRHIELPGSGTEITVLLVEHVGEASVSAFNTEVETFVSSITVRIEVDDDLKQASRDLNSGRGTVGHAFEAGETLDRQNRD